MDFRSYLTLPNLDSSALLALVEALRQLAPDLPGSEPGKARLEEGYQGLFESRNLQGEAKLDKRQLDSGFDCSWHSLRDLLELFIAIKSYQPELAAKAQEVKALLFGDEGLRFAKLPYREEWIESKLRLERITPEVEATLEALGGSPVLAAVRQAHRELGESLGLVGTPIEKTVRPDLREPMLEMRKAIHYYTMGLLYLAVDETSEAKVKAALQPILEL